MIDIISDDDFVAYGSNNNMSPWYYWKDCSDELKAKINNRQIKANEIVFDYESETEFLKAIELLKDFHKIVVKTGSRGYHIHLFFKLLDKFSFEERKQIRKEYYEKYGGDFAKASENTLISMANKPHWKTGVMSEIIFSNPGLNNLDEELLRKAALKQKEMQNFNSQIKPDDSFRNYFETDPFYKFLLENNLPADNVQKNSVILKNLAIAGLKSGKTLEELQVLIQPLLTKWNHPFQEFLGWYNQFKTKESQYNYFEINKWNQKYQIRNEPFYNIPEISEQSPERIQLTIPHTGKLISEFANEVANIIINKSEFFYRQVTRDIVKVEKEYDEKGKGHISVFSSVKPTQFITLLEKYINPGIYIEKKGSSRRLNHYDEQSPELEFKTKSITNDIANVLLQSENIQRKLLRIDRILSVPLPMLYNNQLTFPLPGYDARFKSWLVETAPTIKTDIPLEIAKDTISKIFKEFCFQKEQDKVNAIAALLTPFIRGLYSRMNARTPIFCYIANRERCGKDYCAGITGILYDGIALEESPLNMGDTNNTGSEFRKKVLAAFIQGKKRFHSANNKGYINNADFEAITTANVWSDRILGKSESLEFNNELEFSLSGNIGITFTPDLASRSRFIRLFLEMEDANSRTFENPNLHDWVRENRTLILSSLYSLVKDWFDKGCITSKNCVFASFPEWAKVCGGIMENAGLGNPCYTDKEDLGLGQVDEETRDMKAVFKLCYEQYNETPIKKPEIRAIVSENELFPKLDLTKPVDQTRFGFILKKFPGRILGGIKMIIINEQTTNNARLEYQFLKVDEYGQPIQTRLPARTLSHQPSQQSSSQSSLINDIVQQELTR